ncbi:MAG: ATP-dependent 6-phosphofructokinase [Rhodothermales bacterium]|nr:ATP-dependent 6-phosphofructokinase [Rhodothermales bacterium]MCA0268345.1 ATP-dependent 6-phosphofructokinase [Bacteroidota bacterium]
MSKRLRVGVLTGGGDAPGLNAVIRSVTKSLITQHKAEVLGFEDGFLGLIERRPRPLSYHDVSGILTTGGTILGTSNRADPFRYAKRGGADVSHEIVRYAEKVLNLDALVVIGGEGTMGIAARFQDIGLNCIGVPKTIDNDIVGTDRTFGFDTAVGVATEALDRLHTTAQSHQRVMILETMGRYTGWIALYAGVAGGADVILIPEIPYHMDEIVRVVRDREMRGRSFTLICVAEGAMPEGGTLTVQERIEGRPDPVRLGGIGYQLEAALRERIRSEVRTTVLGHIQRGGTPSAYDRTLATAFGSYAADLVAKGRFGQMVALRDNQLQTVPLSEVVDKVRLVPRDAPMVAAALSVGTSFGIEDFPPDFGTSDSSLVS